MKIPAFTSNYGGAGQYNRFLTANIIFIFENYNKKQIYF